MFWDKTYTPHNIEALLAKEVIILNFIKFSIYIFLVRYIIVLHILIVLIIIGCYRRGISRGR